jgi:uncharacterized protein YqgQ
MKIFVAYRFTGEDINELEIILSRIKSILESKGGDIFCSLFLEEHFKNEGFSSQEIYDYCSQQLKKHGIILFFIKSEDKSKGMEIELEEAIKNNKKIILVIRKNLHFAKFRNAAHQTIEFNELSDLYDLLAKTAPHL